MKKMLIRQVVRVLVVAAFAFPGLAAAQWYFGAGVGQTNTEYLPTFNAANSNIDDSDSAVKVFVGHSFGPHFAAEFEYADLNTLVLATSPGQTTQIDGKAFALSLVGSYPVYTNLSMFGRIGIARWDTDLVVTGASGSDNGLDPVVGIGLQYSWLQLAPAALKMALEWTQYQNVGEGTTAGNTRLTGQNVDVLWLRLSYHLP